MVLGVYHQDASRAVSFQRLQGRIGSWPLPASHGCQRSLAHGCITPMSALSHCLLFCTQISLSLIGTLFLTFREDQDRVSISRFLIQSQLQSSFCHMRLYSQIPGIWIWMSLRTVNQPTASFLASRFSGPSQMARLIL